MNRNASLRGIHGIAKRNGLAQRSDLLDVAMTVLDLDQNDPISSLTELSTKQLESVYHSLLWWKRIEAVRDANGTLIDEAKTRLSLDSPSETKDQREVRLLLKDARRKGILMPTMESGDAIKALMASINSAGKGQVLRMKGSTGLWPEDKIIHTGSLDLDMSIGIGGIPRGRICEIYGAESSGKSSLMQMLVGQAQKAGMVCMYLDAEYSLDPKYATKLGVNLDELLINYPNHLQEAIQTMRRAMDAASSADMPDLLIVVDSVPAMPAAEVEDAETDQQFRAVNARHWSQWMGTLMKACGNSNSTIMLINQTRTGQSMYDKTSDLTPGGKAIKFAASVRLEVKRKTPSDGKQFTTVKVVKNKVGSPSIEAEYNLYLGEGINRVEEIATAAVAWGGIEKNIKYEEDQRIEKNNWFSFLLTEKTLALIRKDEYTNWCNEKGVVEEEGVVDESYPGSEWADDAYVLQAYQEAKFLKELALYPSLIDAIRDQTLLQLNSGDAVEDLEGFEDSDSEVSDN